MENSKQCRSISDKRKADAYQREMPIGDSQQQFENPGERHEQFDPIAPSFGDAKVERLDCETWVLGSRVREQGWTV
jgi:hypothetical protein